MKLSKEIMALVAVAVIIAVAWTVHSLIDTQLTTAPDQKALQQNTGEVDTPRDTQPPAGTTGENGQTTTTDQSP